MIAFSPQPAANERPNRFPSPFDRAAVHPLAARAAREVQDSLQSASAWQLHAPGNGKMFGVLLVAAPDGTLGYLRAFSGMIAGTWDADGWAPPTFDRSVRDAVWVPGEAEMLELAERRAALVQALPAGAAAPPSRVHAELQALDAHRAGRSRALMQQIQDSYRFRNAHGEWQTLRALFAPAEPPAGAGDCAAPKLLAHAWRLGLQPLALAEFWFGATSASGDRRAGVFYAACRGKCLPILTHMLRGLPADPPPLFGSAAIDASEPRVVHEDAQLLVVDKPSGLLTVPGRSASLQDCVVTRLRSRIPDAQDLQAVHRLDLDTSGLLLLAKDRATLAALQRLFSRREVDKEYVAWLHGTVPQERGRIVLPLRVDVDDRPRQIHDPVHGRAAETEWRVDARDGGRTRVRLTPRTGRTHQLRVHASHPEGLDAPIVGDRLYGRVPPEEGDRLLLHAERLAFVHPATQRRFELVQPAPF